MAKRRERNLITGLITVITIYLLEAASVAAMFTDLPVGPVVDLLLAFAFHLGAACVVSYGFWGPWDFRFAEDKNWAAVGFVLVLAIPVYGLLGYSGAYAAVYWRRKLGIGGGDVVSQFEKYIAYEAPLESRMNQLATFATPSVVTDPEEDMRRRASVAPLADVIRSGSPELKRGAIFSLSRLERKTAVKILRDSLGKVDSETQFYVAGRLGQIEKELSDRIIRTRRMLELEPDNLEMKVRLARYNKEYVESGLLEPSVERYFVRRAMELCNTVLDEDPRRVDVMVDLAELRDRNGETVDAIQTYRRVLDIEPQSTGARVGLARAYFKMRDMGNLSVILEQLHDAGDVPDDLQPVIDYWQQEQAHA